MNAVPAGIWLRVSDDSQDEGNQLPDLEGFCAQHGYAVKRTFRVHGKSAWKTGKLDKDKAAVLDAFKLGEIKVLVVWSVDRWSRTGIADTVDGLRLVKEAGGRVEFVKDNILNVPGDIQELLLAVLAWVAKWESEHRSERTRAGHARRRAEGAIMGGHVPFGYKLVDGVKVRVEQELDVVVEVFERSVRGESTATIAEFMGRAGYPRLDRSVPDILRRPDYVADGVVSGAQAARALAALEDRRTGGVRRTSAQDYSGVLTCRCGKLMYRKWVGGSSAKGIQGWRYYRCRDHEGSPVPMVRADDADELIDYAMRLDWLPWQIPVRVGGDTREADKARVWQEIEKATKRRDMAGVIALNAQLGEIEAQEPEPERTEWIDSGRSRGQHWEECTVAEKRAWLDSEGTRIVAWNVKEPHTGERWFDGEAWARGKVRLQIVLAGDDNLAGESENPGRPL